MTSVLRSALGIGILCLLLGTGADARAERIRGITISTHRDGRDWGWPSIAPTLDDIAELGANWVAIHPYAWIRDDGQVVFQPLAANDPAAHLRRPIEEAHRRGLEILIKPHLGYWGSRFSWRGEIAFEREEDWARFFDSYQKWIVNLAEASTAADGLCVGTELDGTIGREVEWRRVIAAVRSRSRLPLCYAANWSDYDEVPFWDALDVIGIQAYFPLTDARTPTTADLDRGWAKVMAKLHRFAESQQRYVLFTELGYNRNLRAAATPWEYHTDGPEAEELQAACLGSALRAIEAEPRVIGAFLWKWFPRPHPVGRNFQLATPRMIESIQRVWR